MTVHRLSILLISCCVFPSFSMDIVPCSWNSLSSELKIKIVACCDTDNRKRILCVNRALSQITLSEIVQHSPMYLTRREHIRCLIQSAQEGKEKILKNLIENGVNCDHEDVLDWLPIFVKWDVKASSCFLDQKLSHNSRRWISNKPEQNLRLPHLIEKRRNAYRDAVEHNFKLICAFYRGDQEVMNEYVCEAGHVNNIAEMHTNEPNHLLVAILTNDVSMVELITIRNPELVNRVDANGCTPLYSTEDVDIARLLLACKSVEVNKGEESNSTTPLDKAVFSGDKELVALLLNHPDCKIDKKKGTPLHIAASQGHNDIIELLLKYDDTLLDMQDEQGYTSLMRAVENEREETVDLLLGYEPDYMVRNNDGNAVRDLVTNDYIRRVFFMHEMNNWLVFTLSHF